MEDNGVSNKELLVARDNKRCRKICGRMQYVMKNWTELLAGKLKLNEVLEKT